MHRHQDDLEMFEIHLVVDFSYQSGSMLRIFQEI